MNPFTLLLANHPFVILDGALATELIGGCCRTTPQAIAVLRNAIELIQGKSE